MICRDDKPFCSIYGADSVGPGEADELTHIIAALLNRLGNKEIKTSYLTDNNDCVSKLRGLK